MGRASERSIHDFCHPFSMIRSSSGWVSLSATLSRFQSAALPRLGQLPCFAREITLQSSQITASTSGTRSMFLSRFATAVFPHPFLSHPCMPELDRNKHTRLKSKDDPGVAHPIDPLPRAYGHGNIDPRNLLDLIPMPRSSPCRSTWDDREPAGLSLEP
jgi:hypothetical protein